MVGISFTFSRGGGGRPERPSRLYVALLGGAALGLALRLLAGQRRARR